ncbi:MAG TPA: LytTR family DNA-binding domain-containing protein [Oscillospiraceae bacterium]|nr:LytTR family DNA-binding domain-containing protein [Oscillospiraceae bacterium]
MRIAICDDEKIMREDLKNKIDQYAITYQQIIFYNEFESGEELLSCNIPFDIIFMDYQMGGISGMEAAVILRKNKIKATIIFLTSYPEVVFQSFEVNTFRFLLKPLDKNKLFAALDDYTASLNSENRFIIKQNGTTYWVPFREIIYFEAKNQYTITQTINHTYLYNDTISKAEILLPTNCFVRCHRSYIVNMEHILNHTLTDIQFDNGERAIISRNFYKSFKAQYITYIKSKALRG